MIQGEQRWEASRGHPSCPQFRRFEGGVDIVLQTSLRHGLGNTPPVRGLLCCQKSEEASEGSWILLTMEAVECEGEGDNCFVE